MVDHFSGWFTSEFHSLSFTRARADTARGPLLLDDATVETVDSGGNSDGNSGSWERARARAHEDKRIQKDRRAKKEADIRDARKRMFRNARERKTGRATYTSDTGPRGEVKGQAPRAVNAIFARRPNANENRVINKST